MTVIKAISDLHGNLPEIAPCDILLIGGDVCPMNDHNTGYQYYWLNSPFRDWLKQIPAKHIVGIAGNHDFVFEDYGLIKKLQLPWIYLQDEGTEIDGLKIWGIPWVPNLVAWAFFANKENLKAKYDLVPDDTDIVLSHGPPFGISDQVGLEHVGAKSANDMLSRVKPQAFVCGHIHEGFGHRYWRGQHNQMVDIYNVSYVDEIYSPRKFKGITIFTDEGVLL